MKEMKKNKYNNEEKLKKYQDMTDKLGKIKDDINVKLELYEKACTKAAAPATVEKEGEAKPAESTYESDIDKIKEKTIDRYRDEYRNFESNYTKKMYEKEQKFKRNQEDINKTKDKADNAAKKEVVVQGAEVQGAEVQGAAVQEGAVQGAAVQEGAVQGNKNKEPTTEPMDNTAIESYQILQNQELKELQDAHENDKEILQQQHKYDELLLLIDWYEYFLNELHTLMIEHPDIEDKDKKDLVNKKAQYNLNMKNNRTMKESGRNMMNKMSSTVNRIKQLYNQNKSVDGEEDEKEGNKGCCTRTPYHDAVTTFDQVYESCVAMIEGFFGVGDEGANNPIIEKVKKILISCIQTYLQFHLEKCMEEHIGTLLIKPPEENPRQQSENPTPTDSNVASEPSKSTTTHAEVIKNQVEEILNKNAIDRCIALHKKIDFQKWIK
jgi:hypothetical protein